MQKSDFQRFYIQHFDRVYRFIFFRVGQNRDLAEDLTSEIFMKALRAFAKYDPDKSQIAWIMTIARNHLYNHYRDQKESIDIEDVKYSLEGEDGRQSSEQRDAVRELYDCLDQLEPRERRLIEMKHIEGYRFKEMATELKKTPGAVRVEAHRAMKKLKKIYSQYEIA
ncbi:MAG: sigma-70 family RNA polymerase sigma factor [bacterium]|nr:sigma-70 family RNA polymerase sigma factor [bacterium]